MVYIFNLSCSLLFCYCRIVLGNVILCWDANHAMLRCCITCSCVADKQIYRHLVSCFLRLLWRAAHLCNKEKFRWTIFLTRCFTFNSSPPSPHFSYKTCSEALTAEPQKIECIFKKQVTYRQEFVQQMWPMRVLAFLRWTVDMPFRSDAELHHEIKLYTTYFQFTVSFEDQKRWSSPRAYK